MKRFNKLAYVCVVAIFAVCMVFSSACGKQKCQQTPEKVELTNAMLGEIQFENGDGVKLKTDCNTVTVQGTINVMSDSQKNVYGVDDVTHVVVLKFKFDTERTISKFEIKGNVTKVYADDKNVNGYAGSLSELLDNESGEDAYCNLILSANTSEYILTSTYTDGQVSTVKVKIIATLATTSAE